VKYIVLLGDGMADYPIPSLGNRTPLQYASTPNMDKLAEVSQLGMVTTVPAGFSPGSDVANLSVIGYDPKTYYTGRSPLEAISMGIDLLPGDISFRCNLVTLSDEENYQDKRMLDYCAGEISSEEAAELIKTINETLAPEGINFYPGISYRHLMVWHNGTGEQHCTPPHDIADKTIGNYLPQGNGSEELLNMMLNSNKLIEEHPINLLRKERGKNPANSIWLWGQGTKPKMPAFKDVYGVEGAMISAVDLTKGIAQAVGLQVVDVHGATGNIHTNFTGKAKAALKILSEGSDFVYLHIEAPDEAGHQGDLETKIQAIEAIDRLVLGEIISGMKELDDYKLVVLPDHPTPISLRTHTAEPVPFMLFNSAAIKNGPRIFHEKSALAANFHIDQGPDLMKLFLR